MKYKNTMWAWVLAIGIKLFFKMESLNHLECYIERFKFLKFSDFLNIYDSLYSDYENLKDRIEFSVLVRQNTNFDLRFGLFKLYDPSKVASLLRNSQYEISNLDDIISFVKGFVPEIALGFDFNERESRIKIYFLRLPDNPEFSKDQLRKINDLFKLNAVNPTNLSSEELKDCYLIGIDFHRANKRNIKIYTRQENVDFSKLNGYLLDNGIHSQYLRHFSEVFSRGLLKDTTISKKYSQDHDSSTGLSIFFEVADNSNRSIEELIDICVPERIIEFRGAINALEGNRPVAFSHIGLTFSEKRSESICAYFSLGGV